MTSRLLFCDTDCLIQVFIGGLTQLLRWFRRVYDLGAVIVPEVEAELAQHKKFGAQFDPPLMKALRDNVLSVFDYSRPELQLSPRLPASTATALSRAIVATGHNYSMRVDLGEAYSHAACVHLGMPMLSHDISAISVLRGQGLPTAAPTLRVFDLVGLAYQQGEMDATACDAFRKTLNRANEFLPKSFRHASFVKGLGSYDLRLFDRADSAGEPPPCLKFNDPYYLSRT